MSDENNKHVEIAIKSSGIIVFWFMIIFVWNAISDKLG